MGRLTLFCVITVAFTGLSSGEGVLPVDTVNAALGDRVLFTTSLAPTQTPFTSIIWKFGSVDILTSNAENNTNPEYEDRITLFNSTGSLELRNLTLTDTGNYSVSIIPAGGGAEMFGLTELNVFEPVSDVRLTANSTDLVERNSSVSLSCSASGSSLSFLWFKDSVEVTASNRVNITDGGATLTIVTVWRTDHGSYTCNVSNPVSNPVISNEELLFVSYGPHSVYVSSNEYYAEGSDVSLFCSARSRPDPQFTWFFNDEMLSSSEPELKLKNIQMNQSGNYSCEAFNNKTLENRTSQPAPVSVLKRITRISLQSSSSRPIEGRSVDLYCHASGSIFTREWFFKGATLRPSGDTVFYDNKRVVSLRYLSRRDSGTYTCIIRNPVSFQRAEYRMTVYYGPDRPRISGPNVVQVGTTLKLSCYTQSVPTARYIWMKNGITLTQSQTYTKYKTVLSDGGEYTCQAINYITNKKSDTTHEIEMVALKGCSTGCIVGIVFGCIGAILLVSGGVFYGLRKKKQKPKSNSQTGGEGRDNFAFALEKSKIR